MSYRTHKQPLGHATRGKTAAGRLRRLDRLLVVEAEALLRRPGGAFVDVGYGRLPTTTLESARRFRAVRPDLLVIGLEIDPERVEAARWANDAITRFRRGGFELPLLPDERPVVVRAMNVLRQYPPDAVADAHAQMLAKLAPGGLLAEGTSTPTGALMVVSLVRPGQPTEVVFSVNPRRIPESPRAFAAVLPKDHIHRMVAGEPVHALLEAWEDAWSRTQPASTFGPLAHWVAAGERLMERPDVVRRPGLLRKGYLLWRPVSS
ncbi:MAG: methylase [Myxococcales bacterium]|nr:methylase [Myxococcales bacterium]